MEIRADFSGSTRASLRCNRLPTSAEVSSVAAQVESNRSLIASLNKELESRGKAVELASASVQTRSEALGHARNRWAAASSYLNELSPIQETLQDTLICLNPEDTQNSLTSGTSITAGDGAQVRAIGFGLAESFRGAIESISIITREAESSYFAAEEQHRDALFELDLANQSIIIIEDLIERVNVSVIAEEEALKQRKMWKLPPEIWARIFTEATEPDKSFPSEAIPMPSGWPHGTRAMLLASVCRKWRQLCIGQNSLWATINIHSTRRSRTRFTSLYLTRKGRLPCSLVVNMDAYAWSLGRWWRESLARLDKIHLLRIRVHPGAASQVGMMGDLLPLAVELSIEASSPIYGVDVNATIDPGSVTKKLALSFISHTQVWQAELTHISLNYGDETGHRDIHVLAPNAVNSLEHAVLRHTGSPPSEMEPPITLPSLQYLETNLSLLVTRLRFLYRMPRLRELVIVEMGASFLMKDWGHVAVELGRETQLEKITVCGRSGMDEEDIGDAVSHIHVFPGLLTVEIRGESVDPALRKLQEVIESLPFDVEENKPVLGLNEIVIVDYGGDGSVILEFVLCGDTRGMQVTTQLANCPNITLDSRKLLWQMNQQRGKTEL